MKLGLPLAVITFFLAFVIGVFVNQSWVIPLLRAAISAAGVLALHMIVFRIIQHFLPELLVDPGLPGEHVDFMSDKPLDMSGSESLGRGEESEVATLSPSSVGQNLDVRLGDSDISPPPVADTSSFQALSLSGGEPQTRLDKNKQVFVREDPAVLAKMVRTRLSDDD